MQLSEIDREVVTNLHNLPLDEQKSILELSLILIKKRQKYKSETSTQSFAEFLREFRKEIEAQPLDIDTSIFEKDRLTNTEANKTEPSISAGEALKVFLKKYENDPVDIDTSIFDSYRKSVKPRDFTWED